MVLRRKLGCGSGFALLSLESSGPLGELLSGIASAEEAEDISPEMSLSHSRWSTQTDREDVSSIMSCDKRVIQPVFRLLNS